MSKIISIIDNKPRISLAGFSYTLGGWGYFRGAGVRYFRELLTPVKFYRYFREVVTFGTFTVVSYRTTLAALFR